MPTPVTQLDPGQVIKHVFDESTNSIRVELDSDLVIGKVDIGTVGGYTLNQFVRNDYTITPVTTGAYVQLIAATTNNYQELEIFDSSGQTLILNVSGQDEFLIYPGGNGRVLNFVAAGSSISIKAISANATLGEIDLNLRG